MKLDDARREGNALVLETSDPGAWRFLMDFKPGEYEITKQRKKRSLDANSFMWALCEKIGKELSMSSIEVYKNAIRECGVYTPLPIRNDAVEEFSRIWAAHGIGWFIVVADDSKIPGYKLVLAYNGSSTYDTKQMSRLIDSLVQDANALGIDIMNERERSLLLDAWSQN